MTSTVSEDLHEDVRQILESLDKGGDISPTLSALEASRLGTWRAAAEAGEPRGKWLLALCLEHGAGVEQDAAAAVPLYRQSARAGFTPAMYHLGRALQRGLSGEPDTDVALGWFRRAAAEEFPAGMGALGEGGHTPNESLKLDTMALAIKRAAIMIYRLSQESHQD